jgi:hypothetical protein
MIMLPPSLSDATVAGLYMTRRRRGFAHPRRYERGGDGHNTLSEKTSSLALDILAHFC